MLDWAAQVPWSPLPDVWLMVGALVGGWLWAVLAWAPRQGIRRPVTRGHTIRFMLGAAVLWAASDWPLHHLAEQLFSLHMAQHMLYALVAAPLLLSGTPSWLWRALLRPAPVAAAARVVTRPLVAFAIYSAWVAIYHWPAVVNLSVTSEAFHFLVHVIWVVTALIMWWPVLSPLPELPHLSPPTRMLYVFAHTFIPTVPAAFLTFASVPLYSAYAGTSAALGVDVITDQQVAGLLMKIGGGLILWARITVIFFQWAAQEKRGGPDPLYWREIERDLSDPQLEVR